MRKPNLSYRKGNSGTLIRMTPLWFNSRALPRVCGVKNHFVLHFVLRWVAGYVSKLATHQNTAVRTAEDPELIYFRGALPPVKMF